MIIYCPRVFVTWRMLKLRENGLNIDYMYETNSVLRKTAETEISDLTFWLRFGSGFYTPFGMEKLECLGYPMMKKFRRYLYSFWRNSRTWQTDGQTGRVRRIMRPPAKEEGRIITIVTKLGMCGNRISVRFRFIKTRTEPKPKGQIRNFCFRGFSQNRICFIHIVL